VERKLANERENLPLCRRLELLFNTQPCNELEVSQRS
jgi:hypothetical protein